MVAWTIPIDCRKCCLFNKLCKKQQPTNVDFDLKLPGIDKHEMIKRYRKGAYSINTEWNCLGCVSYILKRLMLVVYMMLLFVPFIIILTISLVIYVVIAIYLFTKWQIKRCFHREYRARYSRMRKGNEWTYFTDEPGEIDDTRFMVYKMPLYLSEVSWRVYLRLSQYLAGSLSTNLMTDDWIIFYLHLWPTTATTFVYSDDGRIIGITEDYSSWSSNESVAEFHEGWTLEVLSVFVDYEDRCRITLNLRNGESIKQPRFNHHQLNELRVWNIVKAHYQCQLSIWPGVRHTWSHFHFNDLTLQYSEQSMIMAKNTLNVIIGVHTYYTATLNAAGMASGYLNTAFDYNLRDLSRCTFILAPWKAVPVHRELFRAHAADDVTKHYFIDCVKQNEKHESSVELVAGKSTDKVTKPQKIANPDAFPPKFVQLRLEMFSDKECVKKHRGFAVYKDYLADNYRVIYEDFVLPLYQQKFVKNEDLKEWIDWMEENGFPGIVNCNRNGNYLHVFATFLWLNVVHSADHTVADLIVGHLGLGASHVPFESLNWYKEHKEYDYRNVLEGKDCASRWRLQHYAMRNRLFWETHSGPRKPDFCLISHHFIDSNLYRRFIAVDGITCDERRNLNCIHRNFIEEMREVGAPFHWLMDVEEITAGIQY